MLSLRPVALALTLAAAFIAAPAFAADPAWKIDPAHSSAEFAIKHFALSTVKGEIPVKGGSVTLPPGKDIPSAIDATLDVSQIDTKDDHRNANLKSAEWFDVTKYPSATFNSTKVTGTDPTKFTIDGNLTMHGVTRPVSLEAHLEGKGQGGRGEKRVAYSAITLIHRRDFNLTDSKANPVGELVVGEDANISIEVEAASP